MKMQLEQCDQWVTSIEIDAPARRVFVMWDNNIDVYVTLRPHCVTLCALAAAVQAAV